MVILNRPMGRVGLGMLNLDVHTKGIRTLATLLKDAGCDVSYLGEHLTVKQMVAGAVKADVDLIGISFSSGAYVEYCRDVMEELAREQAGDIAVMVGGLIHADDRDELRAMGVQGIFGPGSQLEEILAFIEGIARKRVAGEVANEP